MGLPGEGLSTGGLYEGKKKASETTDIIRSHKTEGEYLLEKMKKMCQIIRLFTH